MSDLGHSEMSRAPFPPTICNGTLYLADASDPSIQCEAITIRDGFVHYVRTDDPLTWWSVLREAVHAIRWPEGAGSR